MTPGGPLDANQPSLSMPFPPSQSTAGIINSTSNPFGGTPGGPTGTPGEPQKQDSFDGIFDNPKTSNNTQGEDDQDKQPNDYWAEDPFYGADKFD